jgi:hypothetical protein
LEWYNKAIEDYEAAREMNEPLLFANLAGKYCRGKVRRVKEARAHHFATDALKEKAELMPDMQSKIRLLDEAIAIYYVRLPERERELAWC